MDVEAGDSGGWPADGSRSSGGRLELDDDGRVLDGGRATHPLDLDDPATAAHRSPSAADAWVTDALRPWIVCHRRAVAALVAASLVLAVGALWWTHRPIAAPPTRAEAPLPSVEAAALAVSVVAVRLDPTPGSSVAGVRLVVRNSGETAVTLTTERRDDAGVEVDASQAQTVRAGSTVLLQTRVLVHDCAAAPTVRPLRDEPHPLTPASPDTADTNPGITLNVGVGNQNALASYALPVSIASWRDRLQSAMCARPPAVSARLTSATGGRNPDGSWYVDGVLTVRTSGIGVGTGHEQFSGPAWGSGSTLETTSAVAPGSLWSLTPVRLDGGAGHLAIRFTGATCAPDVTRVPATLPLYVLDATQGSYPFTVPLDSPALRHAVTSACAIAPAA